MKKHHRVKIVLLTVAVALVAVLVGAWTMFGTQLTEANSIQKLCTFPAFFKLRGQYIDFDLMNRTIHEKKGEQSE